MLNISSENNTLDTTIVISYIYYITLMYKYFNGYFGKYL